MFTADDHETLGRAIDAAFARNREVSRLSFIVLVESADVRSEILELVTLLPPGMYTRQRLCDQLNAAITAHGWGTALGTFE